MSNEAGNVVRPRHDRNFEIGELRIQTTAANNEVRWALGEPGLSKLMEEKGKLTALHSFAYRAWRLIANLAVPFQPRTITLSGEPITGSWDVMEPPIYAQRWMQVDLSGSRRGRHSFAVRFRRGTGGDRKARGADAAEG